MKQPLQLILLETLRGALDAICPLLPLSFLAYIYSLLAFDSVRGYVIVNGSTDSRCTCGRVFEPLYECAAYGLTAHEGLSDDSFSDYEAVYDGDHGQRRVADVYDECGGFSCGESESESGRAKGRTSQYQKDGGSASFRLRDGTHELMTV